MKYNAHKKYALFIGRWQPFHNGHKYLIDRVLSEEKNVCVAIRNTEISKQNPYSVEQCKEMIERVYGSKVQIITIPDIESINIGRKVGYDINRIDAPEEIIQISGTKVRNGEEIRVPKEVAEYIKSLKTTIWLTGLPCSGKTTLARLLKKELDNRGYNTIHIDGNDVRSKLNKDLGFSEKDRFENLRRVAHVSQMFNDNGNLVIASFISPTNKMRKMTKEIIENMYLVYSKCSLEECKNRDVNGMYEKACRGEIKEFTGISAPFEEPIADLIIDTENNNPEECVKKILKKFEGSKED